MAASRTREQVASNFSRLSRQEQQTEIARNIALFEEGQHKQDAVFSRLEEAGPKTELSEIRLSDVDAHTKQMNHSIAELIVGLDVVATGIGDELAGLQQNTLSEKLMGIFSDKRASQMRETRVRNADIDQNLQNLLSKSNQITALLQGQLERIVEQREIVEASLEDTLKKRQVLIAEKASVTGQIDAMVPQLTRLQDSIANETDPSARSQLQTEFEMLNASYNALKGKEQELLAESQTEEGHIETYRIYLTSLQTQENTQRVLLTKIKTDTGQRAKQWAALMESMKTAAIQNNAHAINDVGVAVDKRGREAMAGIQIGTERRMGDMLAAHQANMAQAGYVQDQARRASEDFERLFVEISRQHDEAAYEKGKGA